MNTIKSPDDDKILIKGWYDDVELFSPAQMKLLNNIPFHGEEYLKEWGLKHFRKAKTNRAALKRYVTMPTCTICGIQTGYTGPGPKTVLPGSAMLKIDFRLVWNMKPRKLVQLLKEHLHKHGFDDVRVKVLQGLEPSTTDPSAQIAKAAENAAKITYGTKAVVMPRNPASGPDYLFTKRLGLESIWTGSGPPSAYSHAHAPNEYTTTDHFLNGIRYIAGIMYSYGKT
jgi:acetylornithine deacetylase/succinyl-diaminopimelate desuccinylase-like protein